MTKFNILQISANAKMSGIQYSALFWCFLILVLDGYDLAVVGVALPSIMSEMGVSATTVGLMTSSALVGMIFGAIGLGALADKLGRRVSLSICIFLFSVFTALAGLADDPYTFSFFRFIAGIGIGGAVPNTAAHMSEYAPNKVKALLVTIMSCGYAVGGILSAISGKALIANYGWSSVFYMAGLPILLIPLVMTMLPESMTYLLKKNDQKHLRKIAQRLDKTVPDDAIFDTDIVNVEKAKQGIGGLLTPELKFGTLMLWVAYVSTSFMSYSLNSWFVKLVSLMGRDLATAMNLVFVFNVSGITGAIVGSWVADKIGLRPVAIAMGSVATVMLVLFGLDLANFYAMGALLGVSVMGTSILIYGYASQFYPPHLRSLGVGTASGVGRGGAIAAPILLGVLMNMNLTASQLFCVIAVSAAFMTIGLGSVKLKK